MDTNFWGALTPGSHLSLRGTSACIDPASCLMVLPAWTCLPVLVTSLPTGHPNHGRKPQTLDYNSRNASLLKSPPPGWPLTSPEGSPSSMAAPSFPDPTSCTLPGVCHPCSEVVLWFSGSAIAWNPAWSPWSLSSLLIHSPPDPCQQALCGHLGSLVTILWTDEACTHVIFWQESIFHLWRWVEIFK